VRPVSESTAELLLDPGRALPDEDTTGCFIVAALGMFLETLRIVAANRGRWLDVSGLEPEPARLAASSDGRPAGLVPFAMLRLEPSHDERADFEDALILARRTTRLPPSPGPLPAGVMEEIGREAGRWGYAVTLIEAPDAVADLMRLNLEAVIDDLTSPAYHDEIVRWLRLTRRRELETRDGLSARCMNMPAHELALLAAVPRAARWPLIGRAVRALYRRRLGPVPRLAVVAGPFWDAQSAVQAGRCFMRLWLILTRHELGIHPFGNLITNARASAALRERTGIPDPWIVFRVGQTPPPPRSERLAVGRILA
jgi:hypothetical protein